MKFVRNREYSQAAKTAWLAASAGRIYFRDMIDSEVDVNDEFCGIFRSGGEGLYRLEIWGIVEQVNSQ